MSTVGNRPSVRDLVIASARICHQDPFEALYSKRRDRHFVRTRQYACWLARREHGYTLPLIARRIGRDHSTVIYGVRVVDALIETDELVLEVLGRIDAEAWKRHRQMSGALTVGRAA